MARVDTLPHYLTDIAEALREKLGTEAVLNATNFDTLIGSIVTLIGETKTVTPTTSQQVITPSQGYNGITEITVNAVTSSIDEDIIPANIKKDISILGVTGTYEGMMSREDYITALELADNILGGEYNDTMNILNQVDGVTDTYTGLGGTEDEVEEILDTIIGN